MTPALEGWKTRHHFRGWGWGFLCIISHKGSRTGVHSGQDPRSRILCALMLHYRGDLPLFLFVSLCISPGPSRKWLAFLSWQS